MKQGRSGQSGSKEFFSVGPILMGTIRDSPVSKNLKKKNKKE